MKRITGFLLLLAVVLTACTNEDEFSLQGKLENPGDVKKLLLYKQDILIDSATLNENNEFKFRAVSPEPDFYHLVAKDKNYLFVASNGDKIRFSADYNDPMGQYVIEGSEDADRLKEFNTLNSKYGKVFQQIRAEYEQRVTANPSAKDAIERELSPQFDKNLKAYSEEVLKFAESNKDNLAGFYAITSLDQMVYEPQMLNYAESLKGKFPNNKSVQSFIAKMDKARAVAIGNQAPDFQMANTEGKTVKLSDFKGQYVLLDFWASWCMPCRHENPNLVKQYHAFKDKGFTILGVSLDNSRDAWLKAIEDDKLAWTQLSELKQWNSPVAQQYQVEAIPASFLLDKEGKIIAKNLRGPDLEDFLKKTLN